MNVAQSSHLQSYEYDPESGTLVVTFQNGATYSYAGVPPDQADGLRQNGGSGTWFHANIRGRYATTKLEGPQGAKKP
jgi:hypothetical protein